MTRPASWPTTEAEVRHWRIIEPYNFFERRAAVAEEMFSRDPYSIDGIVLSTVALSSLADWRYKDEVPNGHGVNQRRFRALVVEHCVSFENRVSIPEVLRLIKRKPGFVRLDAPIRRRYPIAMPMQMRLAEEDPPTVNFTAWMSDESLDVPDEILHLDYAGCIFALYRNSVLHELRVAKDREARYVGIEDPMERPIFYANQSGILMQTPLQRMDPVDYIRFGVHPPYLLKLLREAIESVKVWAVTNDRNLFE